MSNTIAATILRQLGGHAFLRMTGARHLVSGHNNLSMRLPWPRVNMVMIVLEANDTYTMTFSYIRAGKVREVARHEDVYCDMLAEVFRRVTGLETRMPNIRFS